MYKQIIKLYGNKSMIIIFLCICNAVINAALVYEVANLLTILVDSVIENGIYQAFIEAKINLCICIILAISYYVIQYYKTIYLEKMNCNVTNRVFGNILDMPYETVMKKEGTDFFSAVNADLKLATEYFQRLGNAFDQIARASGVTAIVFDLDVRIGLLLFSMGGIIVIYKQVISPRLGKLQEQIQEDSNSVKKITKELYASCKYSYFFDFRILREKYESIYNEYIARCLKKNLVGMLVSIFDYFIGFMQTYLPLVLVLLFIQEYTLGSILALITNVATFMLIFRAIGNIIVSLQESLAGVKRILPYIEITDDTEHVMNEEPSEEKNITATHLCYKYDDNVSLSLDSFEWNMQRHQGVVGQKGCGKSTFIKILVGLLENYEGNVKINGCEVKYMEPQERAKLITYLPQTFPVFDMSVFENFKLVAPEKNEEEYMRYAALVNMKQEIMKMPQGIYTRINSQKISTGQRQRIALCMALLRDTEIIVLDEPISNLDEENISIIKKLFRIDKNRHYLVVSHDKSIYDDSFVVYEMR